MDRALSVLDIEEVKRQAREKLGECRKTNDIIGGQIFAILGLYARVIYYPLGEDAPWGFTRISGSRNDAALKKPFAAINTSIPIDRQVFAAAHELYHIWYEQEPDVLPPDLLDEAGKAIHEKRANRFAAEFLVDEMLLRQEMDLHKMTKITMKEALQLADLFTVPYQAMVKRLREIGAIGEEGFRALLSESQESIQVYQKRYALRSLQADGRIAVDNLAELAVSAFERHLITYEKLEYLLGLCGLKTEELGIPGPPSYEFPPEEELDRIRNV